ncbi:Scr1 family TA system antitoxin-like transcriptional regulator, partial [Actinomadura adrarensis]
RDALISESEASVVHTYAVQAVPELARAEPYARFLIAHDIMDLDEEQEWSLLRHRQEHQAGGRHRFLDVIVDEMALTMPVPREVMVAQLRHLLELGDGVRGRVRVVPRDAAIYEDRAHPFDVLEFPLVKDRVSLVHTILGIDFAFKDLTDIWEFIEERSALSPEESRELLGRHLTGLTADA